MIEKKKDIQKWRKKRKKSSVDATKIAIEIEMKKVCCEKCQQKIKRLIITNQSKAFTLEDYSLENDSVMENPNEMKQYDNNNLSRKVITVFFWIVASPVSFSSIIPDVSEPIDATLSEPSHNFLIFFNQIRTFCISFGSIICVYELFSNSEPNLLRPVWFA